VLTAAVLGELPVLAGVLDVLVAAVPLLLLLLLLQPAAVARAMAAAASPIVLRALRVAGTGTCLLIFSPSGR